MTISVVHKTAGTAASVTSATSASHTPASNKLQLLTVQSRTDISTDPNQPTVTGNGLTWVAIASVVYDPTGASRKRVTMFRAMGASPTTGTTTIDFGGQTQTDIDWIVDEQTGMDTSGTNGSGAVVQNATNVVLGTSITVTLAAFGSAANATYGGFAGGSDAVGNPLTVGTGFTLIKIKDRVATEFRSDNDTTVDMTVTTTASLGGIAIEVKAGGRASKNIRSHAMNHILRTSEGIGRRIGGARLFSLWEKMKNEIVALG